MRIQGIPQDKTPGAARFAGGVSNAVGGFIQGIERAQALEHRERLMALREKQAQDEREQREHYDAIAEQRMRLAFDTLEFQKAKDKRTRDTDARKQASLRSVLGPMLGGGGGALPAGQQGPPAPGSATQFLDDGRARLRAAVESGDMDVDTALKAADFLDRAAIRDRMNAERQSFGEELYEDARAGLWTTQGTTGRDYTGDGTPDPAEGVLDHFGAQLGDPKADVFTLRREYRQLKHDVRADLHRQQVWTEAAGNLATKYATLDQASADPNAKVEARVILSKIQAGEYEREFPGNPRLALEIAEADYSQALQGFEPVVDKQTGVRTYVKPEDKEALAAKEHEMDLLREYRQFTGDLMKQAVDVAGGAPNEKTLGREPNAEDWAAYGRRVDAQHRMLVNKFLPPELKAVADRARASGSGSPFARPAPTPEGGAPAGTEGEAPRIQTAPPTWTDSNDGVRNAVVQLLENAVFREFGQGVVGAREEAIASLKESGFDPLTIPAEVWARLEEAKTQRQKPKTNGRAGPRTGEIRHRTRGMDQ